jgi:hypothetical protein
MEAAGKITLCHDKYLVWKIEGKTIKLLIAAYSSTSYSFYIRWSPCRVYVSNR